MTLFGGRFWLARRGPLIDARALITRTVFTFVGSAPSFFGPLVMLKSSRRHTLLVGFCLLAAARASS